MEHVQRTIPGCSYNIRFFHLSENIHEYARFLYHEDEIARKRWVDDVITAVKEGKVDEAICLVETKKVVHRLWE